MAKTHLASGEPTDPVQERYGTKTVEAAIKEIKTAFDQGRWSNSLHGKSLYGSRDATIPKYAAERGLRRNTVERSRQFARTFSQKDLNKICRECRNADFPLGVTLIYRSMAIRDPQERMKLLYRVIAEGWTQARLGVEIRRRTGATKRDGRRLALPDTRNEARQQIIARLSPNLRWLVKVKGERETFIDGLTGQVDQTITALQALVRAASRRRRRSR